MTDFRAHEPQVDKPTAARLYDWFLGGTHNYAVDKAFGQRVLEIVPWARSQMRYNREFLGRAVRTLAEQGVTQFLDIGSGVPTVGNVHEVAHEVDPSIRVVYVDNDNEAIIASRQLLGGLPTAAAIGGDLLEPDTILNHPDTKRLIRPDQPVALLMVAILHFVQDEQQPYQLVRRYLDWLPSGSYFVCSHVTDEEATPTARQQATAAEQLYGETANPLKLRGRAEFERFFHGLELMEPGISFTADWRATTVVSADDPARPCNYAAVGRKP